jgi:hypothetical protein
MTHDRPEPTLTGIAKLMANDRSGEIGRILTPGH